MKTMTRNLGGVLQEPRRNEYFYGKLLSERDFEMEQNYFTQMRAMLNRLISGHGVVCGLGLEPNDDNGTSTVILKPGIAIDNIGREIIVPEAVEIDPRQLTDPEGNLTGEEPAIDSTVEICLLYAEKFADPVPVLVPDCSTPGDCAPGTIRESYCVVIRPAEEPQDPADCEFDFTAAPVQELLCQCIAESCPEEQEASCLSLARITITDSDLEIDICTDRPLVYSNPLLHELILCLGEAINQVQSTLVLNYVSGNSPSLQADNNPDRELVLQVLDLSGQPVSGITVNFKLEGNNTIDPVQGTSGADGLVNALWQMNASGDHRLVASIDDSPFNQVFEAFLT